MADVLAAVDSTTGAFGPLVQNRLHADMQTAINAGVTTAINGMPDVVAAITAAFSPLTTSTAVKAASANKRNISTGWFHATDYGAVHDGTTYDNDAIQAAINAATTQYSATGVRQRVYLESGTYLLTALSYYTDAGVADGSVAGIIMRDGVELFGTGTLKVRDGAYGGDPNSAYFAAIRSKNSGLSNALITGITVDGNRAGNASSHQCSNIVINAANNVVIDGIRSINANGNSIMVVGTTTTFATNIVIRDCYVDGAATIGIQCSQFNGLQIIGNTVKNTADNSIDIYGDDGSSTTTHGIIFEINNNRCSFGGTGIFLETVSHGVCTGNIINDCAVGFHVNRIHGAPENINITGNTTVSCPIGFVGTGDTLGVTVSNNYFNYFTTAGVQLGGAGRISNYYILNNTMIGSTTSKPLFIVASGTEQATKLIHRGTVTLNTDRGYDNIIYINSGANTFAAASAPGS